MFFFSSRRRHTRCSRDWSSDVCSSDLTEVEAATTLSIIYTYYERKFEEGTRMCESVLTKYPDSFDVMLYQGINLYYLKEFDKSIASMQDLRARILSYSAKHDPNETVIPLYRPMEREVRYWMARAKVQQKKHDE